MTTWSPTLTSTWSTSTRTPECMCLVSFLCQRIVIHCTCTAWPKSELCLSRHLIHMRSWCVRFSLAIDLYTILTFYLTHFLSHSFHFVLHLKFVDNNLRIPPKESMDSFDETYLHTAYEPNAYDFKETSVEPYTELLNSPPFFSDKGFPEDVDYDDAALEGVLREAHRVHSHHSQQEDLSVSLSSSSVSDRTRRPVGDRAGRPAEQSSQEAQIRTLLDNQKEQILAGVPGRHEFQAAYDRRSLRKLGEIVESQQEELHCARAEELQRRDQQLLHGQLLQQNLELREGHQKSPSEMEELKIFQSSTFDTLARRRLVEDQDTILELSGRIQELQNEVNCMNDSKDFQDAESIRSGNFHVASRPVSFPPHPIPEGMPSRSIGMPSRRDGPPSIWDTHGISGNVFENPAASSSAPYPQELNPCSSGRAKNRFTHRQRKRMRRQTPESRSEMPVWTVSQKFCHPQWRRLFKELWCRPTTTADLRSSFWQIPYTSNVCLLEDKIQDWGMYLFTIPYGSYAMDQWSGDGWFSGRFKIFVINMRYFNAEFWSTWCEDCFSAEQNHPQFSLQKKNQSGGTKGPEAGPFPSWQTDCLLDLRLLPGHWNPWFCRELCRPIHYQSSKWWYSGIRFKVGRNFIVNDKKDLTN